MKSRAFAKGQRACEDQPASLLDLRIRPLSGGRAVRRGAGLTVSRTALVALRRLLFAARKPLDLWRQ